MTRLQEAVFEWFADFNRDRRYLDYETWCVRLVEVTTADNIVAVQTVCKSAVEHLQKGCIDELAFSLQLTRCPSQHNAIKLPWPNVFVDGDVEKWIRDFDLIAPCKGVKGSAHMVTALGALLTGRARAAYDLNLESNQALDYENFKSALVAEFPKEGNREEAMSRFYATEYNRTEDPLVHYQYMKRQISLGLPEANNKTPERLAKERFIQSMPAQMKDKLRLAGLQEKAEIHLLMQDIHSRLRATKSQCSSAVMINNLDLPRIDMDYQT
ncbi:unnamed protein product [Echinostoma caproni]|uniref:Uncharacterized protein n=1 Tax=Echinostoma caproni TaxID=27848 RepID=A0A183ATC7_9TREM|nr:unnamed protein product [Echinostoma caproni]